MRRPGAKMDDFTHDSVTWTLTAHEARPGHELQFATMMEGGVSIARAVFAFNSANVEGWGLYAEALVKQYLPLNGQVGTLQLRLMREARAFLDPMVNLGLMEPAQAEAFLVKEVGLSAPMAKQEIDRYTIRAPGQATAYYLRLPAPAGAARQGRAAARRALRTALVPRLHPVAGPAAARAAGARGARAVRAGATRALAAAGTTSEPRPALGFLGDAHQDRREHHHHEVGGVGNARGIEALREFGERP